MMRRTWRRLQDVWRSDHVLSVFVGLLVLFVFLLPSLVPPRGSRSGIFDLVFSIPLLAGVAATSTRPVVRRVLLGAVITTVALRLWPSATDAALEVSSLVSLGIMTALVLSQTFRAGPVNLHRIQGAVAAYLLLGLVWASAYELVALLVRGAFVGAGPVAHDSSAWIYFSFVTLTTVGYGDVTPAHTAARSLAMLEALTGQLYPAILLARLVSLAGEPPEHR